MAFSKDDLLIFLLNIVMLRTDPLTEAGKIDVDFFASDDYPKYQKILLKYLNDEGFDSVKENFVIDFLNRKWYVSFPKKKRSKK